MNELSRHDCKECGMLFTSKEFLENHKNKKFKEKMLKADGMCPAKGSGLCSLE
jgi:hypothetical protein